MVEASAIVEVEEVVDAVAVVRRKGEVVRQARADLQKGRDLINHLRNRRMVMPLNHQGSY